MQAILVTPQNEIFSHIEPIFIEHFKNTHGNTPTIIELKQHLISIGIDHLVAYLREINQRLVTLYSESELAKSIQLYIRKLY